MSWTRYDRANEYSDALFWSDSDGRLVMRKERQNKSTEGIGLKKDNKQVHTA